MTATPSSGIGLADILGRTRYLLLDFDGPVCDIFAGLPASTVAERLREIITSQGIHMPDGIVRSPDPIEIFTYSATVSADLAAQVEAEMAEQELAAVATATPTPGVNDVITSCRNFCRSVAVVSNNSDRAVRSYLAQHGLANCVEVVSARAGHDPALLKPSPHLIEQAMGRLDAPPAGCILVGDTTTDMQAALLAGIHGIGYANKPGKRAKLSAAGATAVVSSLADLVRPLRARPLPN